MYPRDFDAQTLSGQQFANTDYGKFPECPKPFKRFWKHSIVSGNFLECPEFFKSPEFLQSVQKFSRVSVKFPECPKTFLSVRKKSTF